MFRRFLATAFLALFTFITISSVEASDLAVPSEENTPKIPKVAVLIFDTTSQWQQKFWLDEISNLFMDRYSYVLSPASVEVFPNFRGKPNLSENALAEIAQQKQVDQVVVFLIERADLTWFPSWHIGSQTEFDTDDSFQTTIFIRGAIYQPATGKYSIKKRWENTTDDNDIIRVMKKNTFQLLEKLEKEVPPLL